ncbi:MAG: hypothetical protein Q9185_005477 [Variospora sp. 1 TL-2023]
MAEEMKGTTGGSLADRLTTPDGSKFESPKADSNTNTAEDTPAKPSVGSSSWADEVETPVKADPEPATGSVAQPKETEPKDSDLAQAQLDGATETQGGTPMIEEPGYEVNVKLSDVQDDPNNPLYSIKRFEDLGLNENILKGIYAMNFAKPSKIQEKALPLLVKNPPVNMIGQSQSGTGKTAAFVLNILTRLDLSIPDAKDRPQACVLAPSRELARQIIGVIQVMGRHIEGLEVAAAIPATREDRGKPLKGHIIVGTPGTAMNLIQKRLINPSGIKVLVLDEADNMLDQQGLGDQCMRVKRLLPPNPQVVLFSATFPDYVIQYAENFAPNANQITLKHEELTVEGIKQLYLECSPREKYDVLVRLYGLMTIGSSIIFVKTRETAREIQRRMEDDGHRCACLTAEFEGKDRDIIIDAFRDGRAKVLIATNVLSRGIDVQSVSLVINYDLPDMAPDNHNRADTQTYLHRIGRTGRFGRVGCSISFMCSDRDWRMIAEIQEYFNITMQGLKTSDWDVVEKNIKAVLKSTRAQAEFRPQVKDVDM